MSKEIEGKDPYAAGKHMKNPEPNNGREGGPAIFGADEDVAENVPAENAEPTAKKKK